MGKKRNDFSRRDFLRLAGAASAQFPVAQFVQLLITGMVERAHGQTAVSGPKYVFFSQPGAPARWTFDHFLRPYGGPYTANPHVGTVGTVTGNRYTGLVYDTIARKGIQVPPIWGIDVPCPTGTRPLAGLLDNMLSIRGVHTQSPGHFIAARMGFHPIGADYSVVGLVADYGRGFPIKALDAGSRSYTFVSSENNSPTLLGGGGGRRLGAQLLNPFDSRAPAQFTNVKQQLRAELAGAAEALDRLALAQHPGALQIKSAQQDADRIMETSLDALLAKWNTIYTKYETLMRRALNTTGLDGVTDKPFGIATRSNLPAYQLNRPGNFANAPPDLRTMITDTSIVDNLVPSFALAELALTENICSSIAAPIGALEDLALDGQAKARVNPDEHYVGAMISLIANTKRYIAIGTCLSELVAVLKARNLFNSTVIHLGAEFNRAPRADLSGSDHGFQGNSATLIGGMVDGPLVIGDILRNHTNPNYPGTWGSAANSVAGRVLGPGDIANALAVMLGLPQVVRMPANERIIAMQAGKVRSLIGEGRQV